MCILSLKCGVVTHGLVFTLTFTTAHLTHCGLFMDHDAFHSTAHLNSAFRLLRQVEFNCPCGCKSGISDPKATLNKECREGT